MNDSAGESSVRRNLLYVILLLVIVLISVVLVSNFTPLVRERMEKATTSGTEAVAAAITDKPVPVATATVVQVTPAIALATPWGVLGLGDGSGPAETSAEDSRAVDLPPVVLSGPPPGSQFGLNDSVTFYWDWPGELQDGMRFALYLQSADAAELVGTADADNLGNVQQVGARLGEFVAGPGDYQWQVVVEDESTGATIAFSEHRPIVLMADSSR